MQTEQPSATIAADRTPRVLLVLMPWASRTTVGIGIATLKAILQAAGLSTDCIYPSLQLARSIGFDMYELLCVTGGTEYDPEMLFTPHYFPDVDGSVLIDSDYARYVLSLYRDVLGGKLPKGDGSESEYLLYRCRDISLNKIPELITSVMESVPWENYDIVGLSLMFHQTIASLCLAKAIKAKYPDKIIIFGGPSCSADMGIEMIRKFDEIDIVVDGEADENIVPLIRALRGKQPLDLIPGVAFRRGAHIVKTLPGRPIENLDTLPMPDYDDYMAEVGDQHEFSPELHYETSRGCWWGEKHLCTFCGLNGDGLGFRTKSADRALAEIRHLSLRYGVRKLRATDNIIALSYFRDVLPVLAKANLECADHRIALFYEAKSNLRKEQYVLMKAAGVDSFQPGIESFSDHVLKLMKKGATALQQVQCIKWAGMVDIAVEYGIIHGNPGETVSDYDEMTQLIDYIDHLPPPSYITSMILDRYSPYFQKPEEFGIVNIRPRRGIERAFPSDRLDLQRLSYHFEFDHPERIDPAMKDAVARCVCRIQKWRSEYKPNRLMVEHRDGNAFILDRRRPSPRFTKLSGIQASIFAYCDTAHSFNSICAECPSQDKGRLRHFLDELVTRKWMYHDAGKDYYLGVALERPFLAVGADNRFAARKDLGTSTGSRQSVGSENDLVAIGE